MPESKLDFKSRDHRVLPVPASKALTKPLLEATISPSAPMTGVNHGPMGGSWMRQSAVTSRALAGITTSLAEGVLSEDVEEHATTTLATNTTNAEGPKARGHG
jgi:hypothetical protein